MPSDLAERKGNAVTRAYEGDSATPGHALDEPVATNDRPQPEVVTAPLVRRLRTRSLRDIKILPTRYLWADYLPFGEVALLVGKPGLGKSTLAATVAAQLTVGQLGGDCKGKPRHILYSVTEDSESTFKARFIAAGGDVDYLHLVDVVHGVVESGSPLLVNVDLDAVRAEIEVWDPALLVLDALNSSLVGQVNDNSSVRPQLERLKSLAHETSTAVLGVGHFKKSTVGIDPVDAIGGAGAYGQVVRQALACAVDEEAGTVVLSLIKSNVRSVADTPSLAFRTEEALVDADDGSTAQVGCLTWLGETSTSVRELLQRTPKGGKKRPQTAAEWLVGYLADHDGMVRQPEVLIDGAMAGFSTDALKRAKVKANVRSNKPDYTSGWFWYQASSEPEGSTEGREESGTDASRSLHSLGAPFDSADDTA
ncbi:AAA family ATPase [Amycolatopsis japonica]|uniref:AAA family ATPase n=1 Tax=Amycolatopsis japonica TaxID=208439 RepID=UPI003319EAC9